MFSGWGERSGLFGFLAPQKSKKSRGKKNKNTTRAPADHEETSGCAASPPTRPQETTEHPQQQGEPEPQRETTAVADPAILQQQREESHRRRLIEAQRQREIAAAERGAFVKKQRVQYLNKQNQTWADAVILGVHVDDDPDKPYYTIKYEKPDVLVDDKGVERTTAVLVEKQTTSDRLRRVSWDEDASWVLLR